MLKLTNTLTGLRQTFEPIQSPYVRMYVCGITPYDTPHLGHARVYSTFDTLYRLLSFLGYEVTYCRNYTDIDDKLIQKAEKLYSDPAKFKQVADHYIELFQKNMALLNCLTPTHEPRVTDHINPIITFIERLIAAGYAYQVGNDVYYRISRFTHYGKLSKQSIEELQAGARVEANEKKIDPLDFALWKGEKDSTFWQSPWGWGRPGWHIECSTLAQQYLGDEIDIHGGGMDLIFPHHENEIAQTEAVTQTNFARFWVHNAFVMINKEKMSKSIGNVFTLDALFETYHPMLIRYYFVNHHYRSPLDFVPEQLDELKRSYHRLCTLFSSCKQVTVTPQEIRLSPIVQKMLVHLLDDLNTVGMLGVVFEHSAELQKNDRECASVRTFLHTILGLPFEHLPTDEMVITPEIEILLKQREIARTEKNWKKADEIREQLRQLGFQVQDTKKNILT